MHGSGNRERVLEGESGSGTNTTALMFSFCATLKVQTTKVPDLRGLQPITGTVGQDERARMDLVDLDADMRWRNCMKYRYSIIIIISNRANCWVKGKRGCSRRLTALADLTRTAG